MELTKIHSDNRGEIYTLTGLKKYPEITIFITNPGYARGGCIHKQTEEHVCILQGEVDYAFGSDEHNSEIHKVRLNVGENFIVGKNTPHYFQSLDDSIVLEWGPSIEEKKDKHVRYRAIVDKINEGKI